MLIDKTLYGPINKPEIAIDRIQMFEGAAINMSPDGYYVAFSGGKDSIVVLDLVRKAKVRHTVNYHITTVDPPELVYYIRKNYPGIQWIRPPYTMWQLIAKKMMPPTRIVRYCCEYLKEGGGDHHVVVTGIRWAESNKRRKREIMERCQKSTAKIFLNPIIEWSDDEVWEYIRTNNLPYCELYDQGFKRIGCVGCPMAGANRVKQFQRWPKFEAAYKRAFTTAAANRAALGFKYGDPGYSNHLRWKNGEDMFRWWMEEDRYKENDEQLVLFE